jgi:hypothetical protein
MHNGQHLILKFQLQLILQQLLLLLTGRLYLEQLDTEFIRIELNIEVIYELLHLLILLENHIYLHQLGL